MLKSIGTPEHRSSLGLEKASASTGKNVNQSKPKILVLGDAAVSTGFARVIRNILEPLVNDYELHQIGISYHGDPHNYPWSLYPAMVGGDLYGVGRIQSLVEQLQPDLVFAVNDLWTLGNYMDVLKHYRDRLKIILYCPIESKLIDCSHVLRLNGAHKVVAYTEFGRCELERGIHWASTHYPEKEFLPFQVEVIPHGVDSSLVNDSDSELITETLQSRRLEAKRKLWPNFKDIKDSFIVLNANRNQPRKRIDLTVQGFKLFAQSKPDNVRLYLHMGLEDLGWNVLRLAQNLGIEDRLILSTTSRTIPSISDEQMNLVYTACDIGLNTSTGEGWGLVNFEHAAAQAPQVITAHEVAKELWANQAVLIESKISLIEPQTLATAHIVTPEDIAAALEQLYQDTAYRHRMGIAAHQNATKTAYSWNTIAQSWRQLFESFSCNEIKPEFLTSSSQSTELDHL